nr:hypothetical protein [Moorella sp. E308F]
MTLDVKESDIFDIKNLASIISGTRAKPRTRMTAAGLWDTLTSCSRKRSISFSVSQTVWTARKLASRTPRWARCSTVVWPRVALAKRTSSSI